MALKIHSEKEAFELLDRYLTEPDYKPSEKVEFVNWPSLELKISGTDFNSSLRTKQLRAFIKMQESLYYQYATLNGKYKSSLSNKEKEELELKISVDKGSTELKIDLASILEKIAFSEPFTVGVIGVVCLAAIYGAKTTAKCYFEYKNNELTSNDRQLDVILELAKENKQLQSIIVSALNVVESLATSAPSAEAIQMNGSDVLGIAKRERNKKEKSDSVYKPKKYYEEDCKVIGVTKSIKGIHEFTFSGREDAVLIWEPRNSEISSKLHHEISMAYNSQKAIYLAFDVTKKIKGNKYLCVVRSIFKPKNKPRSYK